MKKNLKDCWLISTNYHTTPGCAQFASLRFAQYLYMYPTEKYCAFYALLKCYDTPVKGSEDKNNIQINSKKNPKKRYLNISIYTF